MDPRPRDNTDPAKDIARTLADIAYQIATFKGKANAYLTDPNYDTLRLLRLLQRVLRLYPRPRARVPGGGVLGEALFSGPS